MYYHKLRVLALLTAVCVMGTAALSGCSTAQQAGSGAQATEEAEAAPEGDEHELEEEAEKDAIASLEGKSDDAGSEAAGEDAEGAAEGTEGTEGAEGTNAGDAAKGDAAEGDKAEGETADGQNAADAGKDAAEADKAAEEEKKVSFRSPMTGREISEELYHKRPIAVMYPINIEAQPQYGLNKVDVFYEIMEEGSMSRQMGIIQDWEGLNRIGNIRSTRSYFIARSMEWDSVLVHFGGPTDYVLPLLSRDDVQNINGTGGQLGGDYGAFYRVPEWDITEHSAYTDANHILNAMKQAGYQRNHRDLFHEGPHFNFVADGEVNDLTQYPTSVPAKTVDMANSFPVTQSALYYNEKDHKYYKTLYGNKQVDAVTGEQLAFDNILIERAYCVPAAWGSLYLWFKTNDANCNGYYITNGRMIHVTWTRTNYYDPVTYKDDYGNVIDVNQGKTMIFMIRNNTDSFTVDGKSYGLEKKSYWTDLIAKIEEEERAKREAALQATRDRVEETVERITGAADSIGW